MLTDELETMTLHYEMHCAGLPVFRAQHDAACRYEFEFKCVRACVLALNFCSLSLSLSLSLTLTYSYSFSSCFVLFIFFCFFSFVFAAPRLQQQIQHIFLNFMVSLFGTVRKYVTFKADSNVMNLESFIKSKPSEDRQFYRCVWMFVFCFLFFSFVCFFVCFFQPKKKNLFKTKEIES